MFKKLILFCVFLFLISGCENSNSLEEDNKNIEHVLAEEAVGINEEIQEEVNEDELVEIAPTEKEDTPEILDFVDVYGVHYETQINPNVPPNIYDDSLFVHSGENISYEDDKYISRLGVDVSKHQGYIDWKKVKASGYDFAMIRIGYRGYGKTGSVNLDERFHENIKNAQANGIDVGVYFFSQAINEEEAIYEANFLLEALEGYQLQLPVVYDPESILDAEARTDNVSGEQFTKNTMAFCQVIEKSQYTPMIYANMLWEAFQLDLEYLKEYTIWYADYEPIPQTPYNFTMWQYTNTGYVDGIEGQTDINIQLMEK